MVDSRPAEEGRAIRRRRNCRNCSQRFTTFERPSVGLMVFKRSGRREPFDRRKIRRGVESAVADRSVPSGAIEELVGEVESEVRSGAAEVATDDIGRAVLDRLRPLDEVAYLRFASVYKEFAGASDFEREMASLESNESG